MTTPLNEGTLPAAVPADRAAMQQALEALELVTTSETFYRDPRGDRAGPAIDALTAVLATSAPPPVEAREPVVATRKPLTPDEIQTLWNPYAGAAPFSFARAIERAHGIVVVAHPKEPTEAREARAEGVPVDAASQHDEYWLDGPYNGLAPDGVSPSDGGQQ